jgi:hypothetical protein
MSTTALNPAILPYAKSAQPLREEDGRHPLLRLILIAVAARMILLVILPANEQKACLSTDLVIWSHITAELNAGQNPYAETQHHLMNWPPFWLGVLYGISRVSQPYTWKFYLYVRMVLIAGDVMLLSALYWVLGLLDRDAPRRKLLLWGYSLNPLLILLTVQHGHYDVYPMICVVMFLGWLIRFSRNDEPIDWLFAAFWLGLGIFTKTFPLVLWPLLAPGAMKMNWRTRSLGIGLVVGPAALSLAPLYILNPEMIRKYVIGYRSFGVEFGLTSILSLAGVSVKYLVAYSDAFARILLVFSALLAIVLMRRDLRRDADRVLLSGLILLGVFTLGSGYGQQYWFWAIPLFTICYREYGGLFRKWAWIALWVVVATNIFECAIEQWLGGFLSIGLNSARLLHLSDVLYQHPKYVAMIRLPMTACALGMLGIGIAALFRRGNQA